MAFVRCKGPDGSEFTVDEAAAKSMGDDVKILDKDGVDGNGRPLPPKDNIHKGGSLPAKSSPREELEAYAVDQGGMTAEEAAAFANKSDLHAALAGADPNQES